MRGTFGTERAAAVALVGLALLTGCGGSDEEDEAGRRGTAANETAARTETAATAAEERGPLETEQARLEAAGYSVQYQPGSGDFLAELYVNGNEVIISQFRSPAAVEDEVAAFESVAERGADDGFYELRGTRFYVTQQLSKREFNRVVRVGEGQ